MDANKSKAAENARILIAEDSPTQALQLRHLLEEAGYEVAIAKDGLEGLAILKTQKPALIISDIVMPEMDGIEFCQKIKEDQNLKDIPVVLLTSLSDPQEVFRGVECGANSFITKPYSGSYLLSRIKDIMLNDRLRKTTAVHAGTEIFLGGEKHSITGESTQVIELLVSTYENAVQKAMELDRANKGLAKAQHELQGLNEQLEEKVTERTQRIIHLNKVIRAIRNINKLIVTEKDRDTLLKSACENLIATRRYDRAWIVLIDKDGVVCGSAEAGVDEEFGPLLSRLRGGELVKCFHAALMQADLVIESDRRMNCAGCPQCERRGDRVGVAIRLEHEGRIYGVLSVSAPADVTADEEEQALFKETAGDIAFGLHAIDLEKQRRQAEEEVRRLNEDLEERVIQRTAELEAANRDLEAYSYSVSHDLRAPLRSIKGFSQALAEDYGGVLDEEARRLIKVITASVNDMGDLIDALLAFSRMGRKEMRTQPIDMRALVEQVWENLRPSSPGLRAQIKIGALAPAQGDYTLIQEVFANLLSNAMKFSASCEGALIEAGCREEGGETVYYVRDNGVGFDMKYADRLFRVFQRLHGREQFEGTGIGLALVQRIIHRHGGRVWAEGKVNEGATLFFSLPKKEGENARHETG